MKKNLKKVISSVIALALSVGSVAMAAPSFSDVPDTASYAQAVNTLAGLGVISGYEDGTFLPDNNITRAEVATMVVAALNRSADAEGSKGTTDFADVNVPEKEWASGYVNIGVSEGFISGYDDGTFKPDNNVTYAEICSMLVRIAGYGEYASYLGGWPNGYLSVASDRGISKGVSSSANTAVTRAQVAQMIYNTLMDVPLTKSTSITVDSNGNYVPELETMDGRNGRDYETLLISRHNAYYVEGHVSDTSRTDDGLDADEVVYTIEYTQNYDDMNYVIARGDKPIDETVLVGDTDAANNLFAYSSAIIQIDDSGDATLLSYIPSSRNTVVEYDTNLIDDEEYYANHSAFSDDPYIRYYADSSASRSTKYNLADDVELYVNGVSMGWDQEDFETYVVENKVGTVQLVDRYRASGGTDGDYDLIFVTYYATAQVGSVNASTGRITFDEYVGIDRASNITLDPEDDDLVYNIYYNGEEIELSALQADDVISIAYNPVSGMTDSTFYEIYVSRDVATGKYTRQDPEEETVQIGGTNYQFVVGYDDGVATLTMADEYTLYLDAFGRIFTTDLSQSSAKLAIIDRYTLSTADDYYRATIYTTDGTARSLEVDTSRVTAPGCDTADEINQYFKDLVYVNGQNGAKNPIWDRVVEYNISSSSGRIISLEVAPIERSVEEESFRASSNALGSLRMDDATVVIDAIEYAGMTGDEIPSYSDLSLSSLAGFVDDGSYTAYAYGTRSNSGTYPLVIVTSAGGNYTAETNFAIVASQPGTGYDNETGDEIYTLGLYYQGQDLSAGEDVMLVNDDADIYGVSEVRDLRKGDVIVFVTDGQGRIKTIDVLVTAEELGIGDGTGRETSYDKAFNNAMKATTEFSVPADANNWTGAWFDDDDVDSSKDITRIVYGPVVDKMGTSFMLANLANADADNPIDVESYQKPATVLAEEYTGLYTDMANIGANGGIYEIDLDSNTNVYVYDYSKGASQRLGVGSNSDIYAPSFASSQVLNNGDFIPWNGTLEQFTNIEEPESTETAMSITSGDAVPLVFAKVVEDVATDVFVILPN